MSNPNGFPRRIDHGLKAAYTWQYGPSDARDVAGQGRNGVLLGLATASEGVLSLSGVNQWCRVSYAPWMNVASLTFTIWIRYTSTSAQHFFSRYNGSSSQSAFTTRVAAVDDVTFTLRKSSNSGFEPALNVANVLTLNQWSFVAGTFDAGTGVQTLTVDGNTVSQSGVTMYTNSPDVLGIGAAGDASREFYGDIGETRFYDRALTSTEISEIYQSTRGDYA